MRRLLRAASLSLHVVLVELEEANAVIAAWHRHHKPVVGHRFSLGCVDDGGVVHGVCVVGRPVARMAGHPRDVLEVTRVATDGTRNACSFLYGAAARVGQAMGFRRIQTYTLPAEGGSSLRATGWFCEGLAGGGQWVHTDGKPRRTDQPTDVKTRWAKEWAVRRPSALTFPAGIGGPEGPDLLDLLDETAPVDAPLGVVLSA